MSRSVSEPGLADTTEEPLLRVENLSKYFESESGVVTEIKNRVTGAKPAPVRAVDDVSFRIAEGETFGLVGESGCGKSTLARTVLQLLRPTNGDVYFKGDNLAEMEKDALRRLRRDMQIVFQDPQSSLNPRMKVGQIIEEPMEAHGLLDADGREEKTREILEKVGLSPDHYDRYPHEFSGGQRQRINLARALSVDPDLIVCDEPTSALDVSVQAQVLNVMEDLQDEFGLTYLFISHDLSVIRYLCDRVAVMYVGQIVEQADKESLFESPQHPYTQALLGAIPVPDTRSGQVRDVIEGEVPSPTDPPSGCRFRTRCPEFIAPEGFDGDEAAWSATLAYHRSVKRRKLGIENPTAIESKFFEGVSLPREARAVVDESLQLITEDEWEEATEILTEAFESPSVCATEDPVRGATTETDHFVGCHLPSAGQ